MADYYTLLTNAGIAYETACKAAGQPIKLSQISVGDGGGTVYNPAATATALKREVWRGPLNALFQDEKNPSWLLAEVTIAPDVGGWYVREAGLWTDTGILYAIVKYPESFKPVLATSGSGKEFYIRSIFETSNASLVTLLIDDTVVKATRAWVMSYLADELAKLDGKQSVRVATTENIVLSGAQQIDGVAVVSGQRVLVTAQTAAKDNGIYVAGNGAWVRAFDANVSAKVTPGLTLMVEEGAANGDSLWHLITNGPITLGTTALAFEMLAGRTGIQAGTYRSLTVDKYGRATGGTNPETLAGFGIKDTYTKAEIEAMIAQASALPVGTMVAFPKAAVPPGFLEIDGSVRSIATYPDLFAYLGTAFNTGGEGAGNFRLPESRGEFLRGWDHGRGVDAGRAIGSYQLDALQNITGGMGVRAGVAAATGVMLAASGAMSLQFNGAGGSSNTVTRDAANTASADSVTFDASKVARTSTETRGRNLSVMWCIKAWNAPINQRNIDIAVLESQVQQVALNGPVIGSSRNAKILVGSATSNTSYAADELVVETSAGFSFRLRNLNKAINLTTVGAGGMDVGAAPVNGYVAIYVIFDPVAQASALLGVNATATVVPETYSGSNMPAGYSASALVAVMPTNASGQILPCSVRDRRVSTPYRSFLDSNAIVGSMTSISAAAAIPQNAKRITVNTSVLSSVVPATLALVFAPTAAGFGQSNITAVNVTANSAQSNVADIEVTTPQTVFYSSSCSAGTPKFNLGSIGYEF